MPRSIPSFARRGVLSALEQQARRFVPDTGEDRMHRYDREPVSLVPIE